MMRGTKQVRVSIDNNNPRLYPKDSSSDEDDDDEGYLSPLIHSDDDDDDDDDDDNKENQNNILLQKAPKPDETKTENRSKKQSRNRRRSSARFLRLSGRFDPATTTEEEQQQQDDKNDEELAEMYQRVIRLNAENRINKDNSWGLSLIENIDKFLVDDDDVDGEVGSSSLSSRRDGRGDGEEKRVNFTKASCTLDASVKIFSYRVDDVHLSSYKVLANLHRTDTKKGSSNEDGSGESNGGNKPSAVGERKQSERRGGAETLEMNLANININKLEQDYDIDPLFRKMSKTFDEGGAKGLLLVNLGVSTDGCNIVFDSKEDNSVLNTAAQEPSMQIKGECSDAPPTGYEKSSEEEVDISALSSKLEMLLNGSSMTSLPLVPQLESLRAEHSKLEAEGFVVDEPITKSKRYANSEQEEKEAEENIHREHLERSRASINVSFAATSIASNSEYANDDYGIDDDDDEEVFQNFNIMDESTARYSSMSFPNVFSEDDSTERKSSSAAAHVLDIICSSSSLGGGSEYEYFNMAALQKMTTGNLWAGSAHWKKSEQIRKKVEKSSPKEKKPRKTQPKSRVMVDHFSDPPLDDKIHPPAKKRSADPLQQRRSASEYSLPFDAKIGLEQLSRFFLRPNATVRRAGSELENIKKVGFHDVEPAAYSFDDGADDSFNDGPGYQFGPISDFNEADDYEVKNLDGIRKVEKVQVGFATVAKKVDVRRLKKDLWSDLQSCICPDESREEEQQIESVSDTTVQDGLISFKDTVSRLDASQAQCDVTLPFYFICILHLANEKGLRLDSSSCELSDFLISLDDGTVSPDVETKVLKSMAAQRERRKRDVTTYDDGESGEEDESEDEDDFME